ncbi:alcohol dehydrogenase [Ignatzschineria indica]|uniref:Alcohol dehydrogenase n=1 Tax=Ignatzschineria indica TaxID=472583 RepID=A0A2U2AJN2_9GAMM|nr:cytochrome c [Ignatzschineria indica]PWD83011.1 alcohol dehydrogenase [Ignatzschineria indica]GGZ83611.1 alcohol dehydrogenase [Ignatzschineria indica]
MKKIIIWIIAILVLLLLVGYLTSLGIVHSRKVNPNHYSSNIDYNSEILAKGEYIAQLADCAACHTAPGGANYAGGLAIDSPFGTIYSMNITPDMETGIGAYSLADFKNAVQRGIRKDGSALYPAMPYPSFTIMNDQDIEALYAYFMSIEPVRQKDQPSTFPWFMSMRWPVTYWQLLFSPIRQFTPNPQLSDEENRGAYIVEGPGHCGACHTPRGFAYQEKAMQNDSPDYLAGGMIDGWHAKSLRGELGGLKTWSKEEIALFLKTGRTDRAAAYGPMADEVQNSSQYWSDEDVTSVAAYLKTLSPIPGEALNLPPKEDTTTDLLLSGKYRDLGAVLYVEHCAICHRRDGNGVPRIFPALNLNNAVIGDNADSVIQLILSGGETALTPYDRMAFTMPEFDYLSNEHIALIVNFIRNSWNNSGKTIKADDVERIRRHIESRSPNITSNEG